MGIRCYCPNGHKLNLKSHLAGQRGICPECGARFIIPATASSENAVSEAEVVPPPLPASPEFTASSVQEVPVASEVPATAEIPLAIDPPGSDSPEALPKIVVSEHQKMVSMRTKAKRGSRNTATLLLGLLAIALIAILWLLL